MKNKEDIKKTQHYTKNRKIVENLIHYIPKEEKKIEPFNGGGDLSSLFDNIEKYDIDPKTNDTIQQDTLLNPPVYKGKYVITNPPYLAKNKSKDKTLFEKYKYDDLYKIFLSTIIDCKGGILVVPVNFITDEKSESIRRLFFKYFNIIEMNIFKEQVFENTTYNVCSFFFERKENKKINTFMVNIFPEKTKTKFTIEQKYGWRLGGEEFDLINQVKPMFTRVLLNQKANTNIKLVGLDTRTEKIHVEINKDVYYGKKTDRIYCTFNYLGEDEIDESKLVNDFNNRLNQIRDKYFNLILTNYRDNNRKRISFNFAYKLLTLCLTEQNKK